MTSPLEIHAVIFDVDGTILDTLPLYHKAYEQIVGHSVDQEIHKAGDGLSTYDCNLLYINEFHLEISPEDFQNRVVEFLEVLFLESELIPGASEIINYLFSLKIPMTCATGSDLKLHLAKTKNHRGLFDKFKYEVTQDEVKEGKPSPKIFLKAAESFPNIKSENILVFEDAPAGILAANAAGMKSVMLNYQDEYSQKYIDDYGAKPTFLINSFVDFDFTRFKFVPKVQF